MVGLAGEHRAGRGRGRSPGRRTSCWISRSRSDAAGLEHGAVGELHGLDRGPGRRAGSRGSSACPPGRWLTPSIQMPAGAAAVLLADDELLGDVDETARQVAGVGRAKRRVGEALAGAVGGDEVLEHRQALAEGGLDRAGDHLAARVGHEALHAGDLAHLLRVTAGAGVHHHVERVEGDRGERLLHRPPDLGVRRGPDLDLLLAALVVGDDAAAELGLGLLGLLLVAVEDLLLVRRRLHVVDRDREPRPRREAETEVLDPVEALGHEDLRVVGRDLLDDRSRSRWRACR